MEAEKEKDLPDLQDVGALGLTMRLGDRIVIGGMIEVVVTRIQGGQVGVAVLAPKHLDIVRRKPFKSR